jgi:uncharacterized protein (DUF927 family)
MTGSGRGRKAVRQAIADAAPVVAKAGASCGDADQSHVTWPFGFAMRKDGLYRLPTKEDQKEFRICGPFLVMGETRPDDGKGWGLLLRWQDRDGRPHDWIVPRALLQADAGEVRARLAACTLDVRPTDAARRAFLEALVALRSDRRVRTVPRVGWHLPHAGAASFVLPGAVHGVPPAGEVVRLDLDPPPAIYRQAGTLDDWRTTIAARCVGNSRLALSASLAFAAPLLALVGEEGGGVHLRGDSSRGKTTALHVAASVWGAPSGPDAFMRQWRATGNALETTAAAHSDCLLPLDEIGQAEPREVGEIAYVLAAGAGKERMRDRGGLRRTPTWRVLFLSSGEDGLADLMARAGRQVKAGMETRLLDVPADAGAGLGLFECIHDAADADSFARSLRGAALAQHGTAGPAFVDLVAKRLVVEPTWVVEVLRRRVRDVADGTVPASADGQVRRAAGRFALAAVAGELATELGITGWELGEATKAAGACFEAWLAARGGAGARETHHLVAAVRRFLMMHGAARFEGLKARDAGDLGAASDEREPESRIVMNRAGWRWQEDAGTGEAGRWHYGIAPDVFAAELCQPLGLEPEEARAKLAAAGLLATETTRGRRYLMCRRRIAGHGRVRLVVILPAIMDGSDDHDRPALAAE